MLLKNNDGITMIGGDALDFYIFYGLLVEW